MGGRTVSLVAGAFVVVGSLSGCGGPKAAIVEPKPVDHHQDWPANTLEKPEFLGVVERQAGYVKGDAEPARIPSTYKIPDWAEPSSTISMHGPKGARLTFHLLPRLSAQRKQDDAHLARLIKGQKDGAEALVVARPWIGWYGQSSGIEALPENRQKAYALRVYTLFDDDHQLEVHVDWPSGNKEAFEEGQQLLAHVVFSVRPASK